MQILPCAAPTGSLEPAPLTDLSLHMEIEATDFAAFWNGEDEYVVRADLAGGDSLWFQVTGEALPIEQTSDEARIALGQQMASILPLSTGHVQFPIGSGGRTVYRIWRTRSADNQGRTKIRAVRAGRSRRLPA